MMADCGLQVFVSEAPVLPSRNKPEAGDNTGDQHCMASASQPRCKVDLVLSIQVLFLPSVPA